MLKDTSLFVNTYKKRPLVVERSEGSLLFTEDGKRYLDFLSGISINNLGYSNPEITRAIRDQSERVIHPSNYYYTRPQIALAELLIKASGLDKVFFANSGTEANEAVLAFISRYQDNRPKRNEVIVFSGSFFGRTYGSHIASNGGRVRDLTFIMISFNDVDAFQRTVSDRTLAVSLELILGHGGIKKMDASLIERVQRICREKDILILVDEVQTGLGRAGSPFLFQEFNLRPDSVTLGKSLGGGIPLSAVLISDKIADAIKPGDYGCTMGGNSLACAAGMNVLEYLLEPKNISEIKGKGLYLSDRLRFLSDKHREEIIEIRCYGLMCGVEVRERIADDVVSHCIRNGLLVDTVNKNTIRLLPPFTVSYEEIDQAIGVLDRSFKNSTHV